MSGTPGGRPMVFAHGYDCDQHMWRHVAPGCEADHRVVTFDHVGWSATVGPQVMGNSDRPELAAELTTAFCRTDPDVARRFARISFLSDNGADLASVDVPTLVLQCTEDVIAPVPADRYVHEHVAGSTFTQLRATGHCPHLSAPEETSAAVRAWS